MSSQGPSLTPQTHKTMPYSPNCFLLHFLPSLQQSQDQLLPCLLPPLILLSRSFSPPNQQDQMRSRNEAAAEVWSRVILPVKLYPGCQEPCTLPQESLQIWSLQSQSNRGVGSEDEGAGSCDWRRQAGTWKQRLNPTM